MSEYVIGICTTVDIDNGDEIDRYYKVYSKKSTGLWFEQDWDTLEQAQGYVKELEEQEQA